MNEEYTMDPLDVAHETARGVHKDATHPANLPTVVQPVNITPEWLRQVLTERNERISELTGAVMASTQEVKSLREDIGVRPTRDEVAYTRRRSFLRWTAGLITLMLLSGYSAIFAHESFRNACYYEPSHGGPPAPRWCDNVFPGVTIHDM